MTVFKSAVFVSFIIIIVTLLGPGLSPIVSATGGQCPTVTTVFARGSGASLDNDEYARWQNAIERQSIAVPYQNYQLGSRSIDGHQYPAVDVSDVFNGNAMGAKSSGGMSNDYGRSVMEGVLELNAYIQNTSRDCPEMRYVLGGYSQGAQVITQTLQYLGSQYRSKVLLAATFGDPKLRLPEGDGLFSVPACDGKNLSPWRRIVDNCRTSNGALGGWNPYIPNDMRDKTWTWCYAQDFVCGATINPLNNSGHERYRGPGMAIDDAANEAGRRISAYLKTIRPDPVTPPSAAVHRPNDVAFVVDTTGSMGYQIWSVKALAVNLARKVVAAGGRVALTEYRDNSDEVVAQVRCGLTQDIEEFVREVGALEVDGGGDAPEGLLHALMTTYNTLQWQQGASKAAIVITDAGYHDPDITDGTTLAQVVKRSLEIDPVNTIVVTNQREARAYDNLVTATSGRVFIDDGDASAGIMDALNFVLSRPVALLPLTGYDGAVGTEFKFDASMSYVDGSIIASYEWDFDGDGVFDRQTTEAVVYHTYPGVFDGNMQVRVSTPEGTSSSASATVKVGMVAAETSRLTSPTNVVATPVGGGEVELTWQMPGDSGHSRFFVMYNDVILGYVERERRQLTITDVDLSQRSTYGVRAVGDGERSSSWVATILPAGAGIQSQSPAVTAKEVPRPTGASTGAGFSNLVPGVIGGANNPTGSGAGQQIGDTTDEVTAGGHNSGSRSDTGEALSASQNWAVPVIVLLALAGGSAGAWHAVVRRRH